VSLKAFGHFSQISFDKKNSDYNFLYPMMS